MKILKCILLIIMVSGCDMNASKETIIKGDHIEPEHIVEQDAIIYDEIDSTVRSIMIDSMFNDIIPNNIIDNQ